MEWNDDAIVLSSRAHGESGAILDIEGTQVLGGCETPIANKVQIEGFSQTGFYWGRTAGLIGTIKLCSIRSMRPAGHFFRTRCSMGALRFVWPSEISPLRGRILRKFGV